MTTVAAVAAALIAAGPGAVVAGRVVRVAAAGDTVAAGGAMVVLHRVAATTQGPVDSVRTGSDGNFRFTAVADSGAILLLSARWDGVEYFSAPVGRNHAAPGTDLRIVVADTAAEAPVALTARHLVIGAPAPDGTRNVVDLLILGNDGTRTRVAADGETPTWRFGLPSTAVNVVLGESDFAEDAVRIGGDTLSILAAIPPGARQLLLHYQLPPGTRALGVPFLEAAPLANVLLEEEDAEVLGALERADTASVEGVRYVRWTGSAAAGTVLRLRFGRAGQLPGWLLPLFAVLLAGGLVLVAVRGVRQPAVASRAPEEDGLLDAIARLDATHAGRQAELPADSWQRYLAERDSLAQRLRQLLSP